MAKMIHVHEILLKFEEDSRIKRFLVKELGEFDKENLKGVNNMICNCLKYFCEGFEYYKVKNEKLRVQYGEFVIEFQYPKFQDIYGVRVLFYVNKNYILEPSSNEIEHVRSNVLKILEDLSELCVK